MLSWIEPIWSDSRFALSRFKTLVMVAGVVFFWSTHSHACSILGFDSAAMCLAGGVMAVVLALIGFQAKVQVWRSLAFHSFQAVFGFWSPTVHWYPFAIFEYYCGWSARSFLSATQAATLYFGRGIIHVASRRTTDVAGGVMQLARRYPGQLSY